MSRGRVLVIDPDPQLCELLAHSLGRAGLSTRTACNAVDALHLFESAPPDLVLLGLDISTPAGLEVLQTVCRRSQTQVIVLGSSRRDEDVVRGLDLGADDYLVKPFSSMSCSLEYAPACDAPRWRLRPVFRRRLPC